MWQVLEKEDVLTPQDKILEHRARQLRANFGTQESKQNFSKGWEKADFKFTFFCLKSICTKVSS